MDNLKFYIVAGILFVSAVVGLSSYLPTRFDTGDQVQMSALPEKIGKWVGKDIPLTERDYAILETKNLVMRQYTDPAGRTLLFYIIYSGDNRKVLHPPEVCYLGGGATITEKAVIPVTSGIKANKMITEIASGRQYVVYWYKAGALNTENYFNQQARVMLRRLIGKKTSSAMIRISADLKDGEDASVAKMIKEFAVDVEPLLVKYVP